MFITIIFLHYFREKKLKATATVQIWKIKTVPCIFTVVYVFNLNVLVYFVTLPRHLTIPLTRFFQVNLKCQLTHTLPWEIIQIVTVQLAKLLFCYINLFLFAVLVCRLPLLSLKHPIVVIQKFCYHGNVTVTLLPSIVGEFPYSNRPSFCW